MLRINKKWKACLLHYSTFKNSSCSDSGDSLIVGNQVKAIVISSPVGLAKEWHNRSSVHVIRQRMNSGEVQEGRSEVDVDNRLKGRRRPLDARTSNDERDLGVDVEGERLALDEAELPEVVAVVRRVEDVGVVQFSERIQLVVKLKNTFFNED